MTAPSETVTAAEPTWWTLRELLDRPELLVPPAPVIPRLVWEGRVTLFAAREKDGKSTLARQAVAALTTRTAFLGETVPPQPVAWIALDEAVGDLVRGLHEHGAGDGILISDRRPGLLELEDTLAREGCRALVIDTWMELAGGVVEDANSASQQQPLLAQVRGIARRTGCGILLLHHLNKAGTGYADSRQLGAGVDVIVEMRAGDDPPTRRTFKVRGRGVHADFALDWDRDGGYHLSTGELSLDARILAHVAAQPGISTTRLRQAVRGANKDVDAAIRGLLFRGAIEDRGDHGGHAYFIPEPGRTPPAAAITRGQGLGRGHGRGVAA